MAKKKSINKKKLEDHHKIAIAGGIITVAVIMIFFALGTNYLSNLENIEEIEFNEIDQNIIGIDPDVESQIKTTSEGVKYLVDPADILGGGPPKGGIGFDRGIPALALENINFVSVEEADEWIEDNELVLAFEYRGEKRVYPLQIMVWHELANDVVAGDPILITYCPLCGSGIAFERTVELEGERISTRFGTSGKLYNSNLVMYDEATDTYWQQIGGRAIIGELTGQELIPLDLDTVVWREWKSEHPDSQVLSQDTGMRRSYGVDPYGSYYEDSFLIFPVDNQDDRLHPKDVIFGIEINNEYSAYREITINEEIEFTDTVGGVEIKITKNPAGDIDIINTETGEIIPKERDFWFAWYAFHPDTKLYGVESRE